MKQSYQDVYPSDALLRSYDVTRTHAAELMTLEYFEAEPGEMPYQAFDQHHILLNLREEPHRVENWRGEEHRDFIYHQNEIIVTPAGIKSGWKWHAKSKVIVITLDPKKFESFAQKELGVLLGTKQLQDIPQFMDADIVQAGVMALEALKSAMGSSVMYESFARIFLTKLIQKYGAPSEELEFSKSFTAQHYKRVLDHVAEHFGQEITIEDMAAQAALSPFHFARLFKQTIGETPYQFVMDYRVEQAKKMLADLSRPMIDIALACGFSDQAHFSRVFKQLAGKTPKDWRKSQ